MPQFLILTNDCKDVEALARRLSVRAEHLKRMKEERLAGKFIIGGAKLNDLGQMCGSMLVAELENREEAGRWVKDDPYVKGRVWEDIEILPFRVAEV